MPIRSSTMISEEHIKFVHLMHCVKCAKPDCPNDIDLVTRQEVIGTKDGENIYDWQDFYLGIIAAGWYVSAVAYQENKFDLSVGDIDFLSSSYICPDHHPKPLYKMDSLWRSIGLET